MPGRKLAGTKVGCVFCGYAVSRYHLKRHQQSEGHLDRVRMHSGYQERESDRAFTIFLHTVSWSNLSAFERRRYQEMKVA